MRVFGIAVTGLVAALGLCVQLRAGGDLSSSIVEDIDHPAIAYHSMPADDPVARLANRIRDGRTTLTADGESRHLQSLLRALDIPLESQIVVFSKTSLQSRTISPQRPRAIYFNDNVSVAWPRGGFIEIAAQDPRQGTMFYTVPDTSSPTPQFVRGSQCLSCHFSYASLGVPGLIARSVVTAPQGATLPFLGNYTTDDRSTVAERWAGWFVTGRTGSNRHLGNRTFPANAAESDITPAASSTPSLERELAGHLTAHSDVVALLVFNHQVRVSNLITRVGWEVRLAAAQGGDRLRAVAADTARELVDALLFVDAAPLAPGIAGSSGFAEQFAARGPRDAKGRTLRDLSLTPAGDGSRNSPETGRLMRYPCSYMIYTEAFDALPAPALDAVYRRLWQVLSGEEKTPRYAKLTRADRLAVVEILRDTKNVPPYFGGAVR